MEAREKKKRNKRELTEQEKNEKNLLKNFHKTSNRHVLVLETDIKYQDRSKVFHYANLVRKAGNELLSIIKNNYEQLIRTKKYKKLKSLYFEYKSNENEEQRKFIAKQMVEMQKKYNVTWEYCYQAMIPIGKKYHLNSVFALTKAEDIWRSIETCLYGDGKTLHFAKYDDLPCIRAKQYNKAIILKNEKGILIVKFNDLKFGVQIKDRFEDEEVQAVLNYMANSKDIDKEAIDLMQMKNTIKSTYRPCYASLVCEKIRGKMRVYLHITLEGKAKPKYNKLGKNKHKMGKGIIGCDIGTQTIAYTSDSEVGLKNLAERGTSIWENERTERLLYRAMDRSRRIMNPDNYNADGTIKKGKKTWKKSKRYHKLQAKHQNLCRKNAINRHLAINEDVNYIRSLGDVFITEPKNAKKLQKRTKTTTINSKGKINRKKRFGKSIKNRCCGYFQQQIQNKFQVTQGVYVEVPNNYKASQYDHTANEYIQKKLSDRMYHLKDGTLVQRDWYSSYLLYSINLINNQIDKTKCVQEFQKHYDKQQEMITEIKMNKIKVMNSGIKIR